MNKHLGTWLFWILIVHILISFLFIFNPDFLAKRYISKVYKTHLLPGPFFSDDKITSSHTLYISWCVNNQWSLPISPAKETFRQYHTNYDPRVLYESRLNRSLYQSLLVNNNWSASVVDGHEFKRLVRFLKSKHKPENADSLRLTFFTNTVKDSTTHMNSMQLTVGL